MAAAANTKVTFNLPYTRDTARFQVVEDGAGFDADTSIGARNLYIRKDMLGLKDGDTVKITLEVVRKK